MNPTARLGLAAALCAGSYASELTEHIKRHAIVTVEQKGKASDYVFVMPSVPKGYTSAHIHYREPTDPKEPAVLRLLLTSQKDNSTSSTTIIIDDLADGIPDAVFVTDTYKGADTARSSMKSVEMDPAMQETYRSSMSALEDRIRQLPRQKPVQ